MQIFSVMFLYTYTAVHSSKLSKRSAHFNWLDGRPWPVSYDIVRSIIWSGTRDLDKW